ncbi:MAG: response regulator transcription factor [Lachnospiraceae bacterium]|nr:response regulator transcription factor [Lachnospiraceae bacterium]
MHYNCLIVDDEEELARMTAEYFNMFDVKTQYVNSAVSCYAFFENNTADIVLLDINLGDGSGFEVCKKLRETYRLPIFFISARQSDDDVLVALSIGGDDYVKKPYSLSVLLAKVKVNLKRIREFSNISADPAENASNALTDEKESRLGFRLEEATMSVILNGKRIALKAKEFALLKCLYDHKNTIVTKEVLFDEVWGDAFFTDGTLNVHIRKLREKIEKDPNAPEFIKTVWGTGYILELEKGKDEEI